MDSEDNVHRLEGINEQKGGLIIKKTPPTFKVPQPSLLGLDRLAAARRKEREENARKISFLNKEDDEEETEVVEKVGEKHSGKERHWRSPKVETPSHTGGISNEARNRQLERLQSSKNKDEKGVYASSKDNRRRSSSEERDSEMYRNRYPDDDRKRRYDDRNRDRHRKRDRSDRYSSRDSRRERTPQFKDEPLTPNIAIKEETSKTSWDDDDVGPVKKSSWDFPTPSSYKAEEGSERGFRKPDRYSERSSRRDYKREDRSRRDKYKIDDDTPRPTPAHRYNTWAKDRRRTGATPLVNGN